MKTKQLLLTLALALAIALNVKAQSIPNGNFETWTSTIFENPQNYVWSSNSDGFRNGMPFNVVKSTDAYHGNYSVQMTTQIANGDTMPGIFVNVDPKNGNPALWRGGFAYNQKASGMRGYYKSAIATPDTGFVFVFFYKAGVMIGQYGYYFHGTHSSYTPFAFSFNPALPQAPDTIVFGAGSSNYNRTKNMRSGSMLMLDSISFTGVSSQPALLNGDFETWQNTTINEPANWFLQGGGGGTNLTGGVFKTTDAKAGNYAIELITFEGNRNNSIVAQAGNISTGWYQNNCNSNCQEQGGYPFSNQIDTLAFWFKYAPSGNDKGQVSLNFKKNGANIGGPGASLSASTNYQYMEIPFNLGQVPDSVMVDIQSSQWQDSLLSYVGSDLKIDEMHFKSQKLSTGIFTFQNENSVTVFPNPSNEKLTISVHENTGKDIYMDILNTLGQQILSERISGQSGTISLDISQFKEGIYFLRMTSDNKSFYDKKIIVTR